MSNEEVILREILQRVTKTETLLERHLLEAVDVRDKVDKHEQSIQRLKGAGWVISFLWGALLTALGIKYGAK